MIICPIHKGLGQRSDGMPHDVSRFEPRLQSEIFPSSASDFAKQIACLCSFSPMTQPKHRPFSNMSNVRVIWNSIAREHGIDTVNPFANMNYGNAKAPVKRLPIPIEGIHKVQKLCFELDDDIRWIIAAVSDSGMRLAEVIGLTASNVHLDEEVPFVRLSEHPWRRLKTADSVRDVPLVGATLWGLKRAVENNNVGFLFPRYCT